MDPVMDGLFLLVAVCCALICFATWIESERGGRPRGDDK